MVTREGKHYDFWTAKDWDNMLPIDRILRDAISHAFTEHMSKGTTSTAYDIIYSRLGGLAGVLYMTPTGRLKSNSVFLKQVAYKLNAKYQGDLDAVKAAVGLALD